MVEVGILDRDARVELIDGILHDMNPSGSFHDGVLVRLTKRFVRELPESHELRPQLQFNLPGGNFLVPDLMIVETGMGTERQPTTAALVVELSLTTQAHDTRKAGLYATAAVDEYWLCDLEAQVVRVHRDPTADAYVTVTEHRDGSLTPLLGVPQLAVSELLARG